MKIHVYLFCLLSALMLCGCMATVRIPPHYSYIQPVGRPEGIPLRVAFIVEGTKFSGSVDTPTHVISGPPDSSTGLQSWKRAFAIMGASFHKSTTPTPDELLHSNDYDAIARVKLCFRGTFPGFETSTIDVRIEDVHGASLFEDVEEFKDYHFIGPIVAWEKAAAIIRSEIEKSISLREFAASLEMSPSLSAEKERIQEYRPMSAAAKLHAHAQTTGTSSRSIFQRWALVIGISRYRDDKVPRLQYATADAKAFHRWLVSPAGGGYNPAQVKLLCDEEATGNAIRDALFNWLKEPIEEDFVTIYYAGHGSPESPDNLENLFLFPYDVDYSKISSTGFPMWDIETSLKRFVRAKRVLIIADACHAAGVGEQFDIARRAGRGMKVNPIVEGLSSLSSVGDSVCVLSAASASQFSQEGEKWGGGHGVFTYFLLQGLTGKADANNDNRVTVGELSSYVSEQVRRATGSAQCPRTAGSYDPTLTIGE